MQCTVLIMPNMKSTQTVSCENLASFYFYYYKLSPLKLNSYLQSEFECKQNVRNQS